jgi:hypothetical protein
VAVRNNEGVISNAWILEYLLQAFGGKIREAKSAFLAG